MTEHLQSFLFDYRSTPTTTTGVSPAELFLGRKLRTMLSRIQPPDGEDSRVDKQQKPPRVLKTFQPGDKVYARDYRSQREPWKPGEVRKRLGRNTWLVLVAGLEVKKSACQLRKREDCA